MLEMNRKIVRNVEEEEDFFLDNIDDFGHCC